MRTLVLIVWLHVAPLRVQSFCAHRGNKKVIIGLVLMVGGAVLATNPVSFVPHFLWDAVAYGLHGYGALPVLRFVQHKWKQLDLENIED